MKLKMVKTERRPNGLIACTIWDDVGYITFVRTGSGKLTSIARTTSFEPSVFSAAVREAHRQIDNLEREAQAATPLPGSVPRLA